MQKLFISGLLLAALSACTATRGPGQLYYWGDYEDLIYLSYKKPGNATPAEQIERLSKVIDRAQAEGKAVAPGIYAQLGMMYAMVGNQSAAEQMLMEEKARFPESAVFIDGMLERAKQMREERAAQ
ncbi:DUF4810 domain-containing protein [Teredinibacter turnerae]|uniref:DUF4810 domain-containing protein n=1 Tax=Teredinibacter turnerae TaxID=2426 RepID=UPI00036C4335|nr:DUF4810 domain-containing protein [Teredinibacter turnerae]